MQAADAIRLRLCKLNHGFKRRKKKNLSNYATPNASSTMKYKLHVKAEPHASEVASSETRVGDGRFKAEQHVSGLASDESLRQATVMSHCLPSPSLGKPHS